MIAALILLGPGRFADWSAPITIAKGGFEKVYSSGEFGAYAIRRERSDKVAYEITPDDKIVGPVPLNQSLEAVGVGSDGELVLMHRWQSIYSSIKPGLESVGSDVYPNQPRTIIRGPYALLDAGGEFALYSSGKFLRRIANGDRYVRYGISVWNGTFAGIRYQGGRPVLDLIPINKTGAPRSVYLHSDAELHPESNGDLLEFTSSGEIITRLVLKDVAVSKCFTLSISTNTGVLQRILEWGHPGDAPDPSPADIALRGSDRIYELDGEDLTVLVRKKGGTRGF